MNDCGPYSQHTIGIIDVHTLLYPKRNAAVYDLGPSKYFSNGAYLTFKGACATRIILINDGLLSTSTYELLFQETTNGMVRYGLEQ